MASTSLTATTAVSATTFASSLGINTHIDFATYGYQNLANVESDIQYLGVKIIRDSAETATDATTWLQVAQATGAKFDDYIAETSPSGMSVDLGYVAQLAGEGILASIEGGNEEDDAYPASLGNTLQITAQFQQQVYALGKSLGLPVFNMSFGAGWTAANGWQGDYGAVGNLSAYTTYGNAHTYPVAGQLPDSTIQRVNGLATLAASTRPVVTTEIGWDTSVFDPQTIAKYVLDAALDGMKDGDSGMYYYGLYDDGSGNWGLFNADGTARPAATALHNLTTLLADTGTNAATFKPGALTYGLSGTQTGDSSVLIEKSNGSFWLSLWNETETAGSPHTVTVTLGSQAASVIEFDPLSGTSSIRAWSNVSSVQVSVPDHPVLLEIVPATSSGNGSGGGTPTPTPPPTPPPAATGPAITVPAGASVAAGATTTIGGVTIADSFAASNSGSMVLNLSAGSGLLTITDASGIKAAGSGTHAITFVGTLAQLTTELAHLSYTAGSTGGTDSIVVDVWDQAGLEQTKAIAITVGAPPAPPPTPPPTPAPTGPVITVPATLSVAPKSTTSVGGISVVDAFAATNPGSLTLNVNAGTGTVTMTGSNGSKVTGSGTHAISLQGTLAQISYDLAHLTYTAPSTGSSDAIGIDIWDQAGHEGTQSIAVSVKAATTTTTATATAAVATPASSPTTAVTIAPGDADPVITVSNATISAMMGNHMIFLGGSHDVLTATGGTETVQAFQGSNTITTGKGNDVIQIGGSGNIVNAGSGSNEIDDSGSGNTIVLPGTFGGAGHDDIFGYVLQNQDILDMRSMLAGTQWNHTDATLGNFLRVSSANGSDAILTVTPAGVAGGASYNVATLHGSGAVSLATVLAHSLT